MKKELLSKDRIRRLPKGDWSWIDRRFLREEASSLGHNAIVLYFFLAAVSDKDGLSYWSDSALAARLRMSEQAVVHGREELDRQDLIIYSHPIYQVLSLPDRKAPRMASSSGPTLLGDVMRELVERQGGERRPGERK